MSETEKKKVDVLFEDIEKEVEVFQHFDEKSYSGKFLGYIKKIRSGIIAFTGIFLLLLVGEIIAVLFGSVNTTWDDVEGTFTTVLILSFFGYILIFVLQAFSIIIKNQEDQILERINRNK